MARELRNALADYDSAKEYAGNALANMREYYDPRVYAQFLRNPTNIPDDEAARRQQMLDYSRYGVDENTEYLGTPVAPMMLPSALAFRGGQSVGQAMRGMGAYSPRAEFMGQARETRPALERLRQWYQSEFL